MKVKKSLVIFPIVITISLLAFFGLKDQRSNQIAIPPQVELTISPTPPAFEYEKYDRVFGTSGPKAIFFTDLFYAGNAKMYSQLQTMANKSVFSFTVRLIPTGGPLVPDPQGIGNKLIVGFTNCVKLLYPNSYTNYLIALQNSLLVSGPNNRFSNAEDLIAFLKSNLPANQKSGVIKCIQENSYTDLANKESDYINKVENSGSPDLYFPDPNKHILGYNDSNYFISQLWDIIDLSQFGYKKTDVQQQIKDLVQ